MRPYGEGWLALLKIAQLQQVALRIAAVHQAFPPIRIIDLRRRNLLHLAQHFDPGRLHGGDQSVDVRRPESDMPKTLHVGAAGALGREPSGAR